MSKRDRDEGRLNWQQIAARRFTPELQDWLAQIAPLVLEADRMPHRRAEIAKAVGLGGRTGTAVTAAVKAMNEHFAKHGAPGRTPQERRKNKDAAMALVLGLPVGPRGVEIDRDDLNDRVRRRLKK